MVKAFGGALPRIQVQKANGKFFVKDMETGHFIPIGDRDDVDDLIVRLREAQVPAWTAAEREMILGV